MSFRIDYNEIMELVVRQLTNLFVYDSTKDAPALELALQNAIQRSEKCFGAISNKYYHCNGHSHFNPFHSGQYSIFLYYLSNSLWALNTQYQSLSDRIYYLNKALNGLDLYYEVEMPEIFFLDHSIGSVIGRARYANYFAFSQNCTVGNNKGIYPRFGENVCLMAGAKVLGDSYIESHVILSANCYVKDQNIPSCSIVFGASPNLIIKPKDRQYFVDNMQTYFFIPPHFVFPVTSK